MGGGGGAGDNNANSQPAESSGARAADNPSNDGAGSGGAGVAQGIAPAADTPGSDVGRTCKADVRITKTNTPGINGEIDQAADTVDSGAATVYTIVVTNAGPKPANDTRVIDPLPAGVVLPVLPVNGNATFVLNCAVQ